MKTKIFIGKLLLLSLIISFSTNVSAQETYYDGTYTGLAVSFNYDTGAYTSLGNRYLTHIKVISSYIEFDGQRRVIYQGRNVNWLVYNNNGSAEQGYLYNKQTGELRNRIVENMFGIHVGDIFYARGNHLAQGNGTYSSSMGGSVSSSGTSHKCGMCNGTGELIKNDRYDIGMNTKWCSMRQSQQDMSMYLAQIAMAGAITKDFV